MAKQVDSTNLGYIWSKIKAAFWPKADVTNITLADVAVTGDYDDLSNKPTIPSTSGNYPDMVVGGAGFLQKANLIEGSLATPRQAAGGEPIGTGKAYVEKIYGGSAEILGAGRGEPAYKSATLKVYGFNLFTCAHLFSGSSAVTITDADDVAEFVDMLKTLQSIGLTYYYNNCPNPAFVASMGVTMNCYDSSDNMVLSIVPNSTFTISSSIDLDDIVKVVAQPSMIADYSALIINVDSPNNGTYVPYEEPTGVEIDVTTLTGKLNGAGNSITIFPYGMFGFWSGTTFYGDYIDGNTAYRRYDTVDMGELEWEVDEREGATTHIFKAPLTTDEPGMPPFVMMSNPQPWFCDGYTFSTSNWMAISSSETIYWDASYVYVSSLTIDNASDMAAALDGTIFHYIIATKTYTIDNLPSWGYDVTPASMEGSTPSEDSATLYAGIRYPEKLITDLDKMSVVVYTAGTPETGIRGFGSPADNTYHRVTNSVNAVPPSCQLPAINDTEKVHKIIIAFKVSASAPVTFTSADSSPIMYEAGFSIEENKYYEVTCLWDGAKWLLSAKEFVEPSS